MGKIQSAMKSDFTMVHNVFLKDKRLGSSERGLLMTMLSKPSNYRFTVRGLASEMADGVTSVSTALNNLEKFGYVKKKREKINGRFGKMDYDYSDEPIFPTEFNDPERDNPNYKVNSDKENPDIEKPNTENPNTEVANKENPYDLISTDILRTDKIKTKEIKKEKPKSAEPKKQYAEAVYMTETEYQTLCEKHSKDFADKCIEVLNNYKLSKGKFYKSDYHAILAWVEKKVSEDLSKTNQKQTAFVPIQTDPHENPFARYLNETGGTV